MYETAMSYMPAKEMSLYPTPRPCTLYKNKGREVSTVMANNEEGNEMMVHWHNQKSVKQIK